MTASSELAKKLRAIALRWAAEAKPRLAALEDALHVLGAPDAGFDADKLRQAQRNAHGLAGGAGTVGFPEISEALIPLEDRLLAMIEAGRLDMADRAYLREQAEIIPALARSLGT